MADDDFEDARPASEEEIREVERALGRPLPEDYRRFARSFAGSRPVRTDFSFLDGSDMFHTAVGQFLSLARDDAYGILRTKESTEFFPHGLVPIAEGGGGDLVALDYRRADGEPTVVFWHHGRSGADEVSHVSDSFTDFLALLREPDDDDDGAAKPSSA